LWAKASAHLNRQLQVLSSLTALFLPATLVTGLVVQVPLFINPGEKIKVDTRTGEYMNRVRG